MLNSAELIFDISHVSVSWEEKSITCIIELLCRDIFKQN